MIDWLIDLLLVALNVQTAGLEMDLNDGLFSQNGCCGYVLKPDFMRNDDSFDPERPQDRDGYTSLQLSIQVQKQLLCIIQLCCVPLCMYSLCVLHVYTCPSLDCVRVCVHQVISGQQLPKVNQKEGSIVDPLVRVEIYGVSQDQAKQETSYIDNNGEGPSYMARQRDSLGSLYRLGLLGDENACIIILFYM